MNIYRAGAVAAIGLSFSALAARQTVPMTMYDHAEPVKLPRLMSNFDGSPVENTDDWERKRRPELLAYFAKNVYGERPVERPADLAFEPVGEDRVFREADMIRKSARLKFSGPLGEGSFLATAFLPRTACAEKPVPAFVLICNRALERFADLDRRTKSEFFPPEEIVRRGYAVVLFKNTEIAGDEYFPSFGRDGTCVLQDPPFTNDIYACWSPERTETSWGAISAWAWGASRVLDWIETLPALDAKRVAVVGHSRGGKTALWAAASDSRFAMACVNDSGCCGAKMNHVALPFSETIQQDNAVNPHWFARAFRKFNGMDAYLPHDQHWIAALVAPRLLYISSASEDYGAGPWGEFLTARHASPAWGLYGVKGLVESHPYRIGDPFHEGRIGYHLRQGEHDLNLFDWKNFMDFADRHLRGKSLATGPKRLEGKNARALDLQAEIDRAGAAGGGVVRVPAGEWVSRPFALKSKVSLELAEGAILFASTNLADYAHLPRGGRYFIFAEGADGIAIRGKGVICGRGWAFRESRQLEGSSQPQDLPVMMRFSHCRNLRLEDFTYRDGGAWGCHLRNCDGVIMRRVTCHNHVNNTNDGLDIESSNVLVEDCDIDSNDDALCFKTESDKMFPVTNVVVRNCRFASTCNGLKFGTGSYCDVKDILIENCEFYRPTARFGTDRSTFMPGVTNRLCGLAGLALEVVDGGRMDGVTIRNVTIDGYMTPVFIRMNNRHDAPPGVKTCLKNVLIENVRSTVADSYIASSITGIPGFRPTDITLRNVELFFPGGGRPKDAVRPVPEMEKAYPECTMFHPGWPDHADFHDAVLPAWGFYLRHADNVTFEHVRLHCVGADARKPIVAEDCVNFHVRQGLRGAAPYRLVWQEGSIDQALLAPDFLLSPSGIEAWADRFEAVSDGGSEVLRWRIFRERATGGRILAYKAGASAQAADWAALRDEADSCGAAIVGVGEAAAGWMSAQRNSPEWDWRRTESSLWFDPGRVVPYEFRIDAPRRTPELTKGAAHVFDFSVRRPGNPVAVTWDEYIPDQVASGEFGGVSWPEVVLEPVAGDSPIRTVVETGMTLLWLRDRHPEKGIVLRPLACADENFAAVVNGELRRFAGMKDVRLEGFPPDAASRSDVQGAESAVSRIDDTSSTRGAWWWLRRLAQKNREIRRSGGAFDLVMIGDSITHFWEGCAYWTAGRAVQDQLARRMKLLNLGYGGDSTQHVLWRILNGELDGYRARRISLMIGTNNRTEPEETARAIRRILSVIAERQPQAQVLLTALLPRGEPDSPERLRVRRVNELIRPLADGRRVRWLDMTDRFLQPDGRLAPGLMTDERSPRTGLQCNLHPYELGYEIWRDALLGACSADSMKGE